MAISLRGAAGTSGGNTSNYSINVPSGTVAGDVTVLFAMQTGSNTLSAPSGWTTLFSVPGAIAAYRVFQAGDPSTVNVTSSAGNWFEGGAISYSGVDNTNPIDGVNYCAALASTYYNPGLWLAPSVSPNFAGDQIVCCYCRIDSGGGWSYTLPGTLTSRVSSTYGPNYVMADMTASGGGPTGSQIVSGSVSGGFELGAQIALKAAGASAVTNTAVPTVGGIMFTEGNVTSFVPDLSTIGVQNGDLVLTCIQSVYSITPPAGYSLVYALSGVVSVFSHVFSSGDTTTPAFTLGATGYASMECMLIRPSAAGTSPAAVDASGANSGTNTATAPGVNPSFTTDLLVVIIGNSTTSTATWTGLPSGLGVTLASGYGPSFVIGWLDEAPQPTSAYTGTMSITGSSTVLGLSLAFSLGAPPAPTASICVIT